MSRTPRAIIAACVELWNAGFSATEIAKQLSGEWGRAFTRSGVLGYVWRARRAGLVVAVRSSGPRARMVRVRSHRAPRVKVARPVTEVERPAALPALALALPSGAVVSWHQEGGCRALVGEDARAPVWCNAPVVLGSPWCGYHYTRMVREV